MSFSCNASAAIATVAGNSPIDPVTAGADGQPCQNGVSGLPNVGESVALQDTVTARTAYAIVQQGGAPPINSTPTAQAGVEDLALTPGGNPALGVGAARSSVSASCTAGQPQFEQFSEVANVSLGGVPLVLDGVLQDFAEPISEAFGMVADVKLNEVEDLADGGRAVRALHVKLFALDGSTAPLADIVVAESRIGLNGAACDPNQPPNDGGDEDPPLPQVCPDGSVFDPSRNVCVIAVPGSQTPQNPSGQLTGPGSVIVGPPFEGPGGGTVITLDQARKRFPKSKCVRGGGPKFALIGTKGRDRLTGTNRRDRMLGLGGKDRLDGGRKADCVEGGKGVDRLSGGQGKDRMFGGKGKDGMNGGQQADRMYGGKVRDLINGGPGNDRMYGGAGNDYINAAYGRDRLFGGKGRDKLNVATAGVAQRVNGGRGFDKVRGNKQDLKFIKRNVERVIITKKIRG